MKVHLCRCSKEYCGCEYELLYTIGKCIATVGIYYIIVPLYSTGLVMASTVKVNETFLWKKNKTEWYVNFIQVRDPYFNILVSLMYSVNDHTPMCSSSNTADCLYQIKH